MSFLTLHRAKNGFLLFVGNATHALDLAEAKIAGTVEELVKHIEDHFTAPPTPEHVVPTAAVKTDLESVADALDPAQEGKVQP